MVLVSIETNMQLPTNLHDISHRFPVIVISGHICALGSGVPLLHALVQSQLLNSQTQNLA